MADGRQDAHRQRDMNSHGCWQISLQVTVRDLKIDKKELVEAGEREEKRREKEREKKKLFM